MGSRDRPGHDVKRPKKKEAVPSKPLVSTAISQPVPVPELVRKKKRNDKLPEEG
jgi:hypothetical protein